MMNPLSNVLVTAQFSVPELVVVDVCHGALELKLAAREPVTVTVWVQR